MPKERPAAHAPLDDRPRHAQEFMRKANRLCAKAQHAGLAALGLGLTTVIDQMREQIRNVE